MFAPPDMATLAAPDPAESSSLIATSCTLSGDGAAAGAVYAPFCVMEPQAPVAPMHAEP